MPGLMKAKSEYRSTRLFWIGVPVVTMRNPAFSLRAARARLVAGFLMAWASSRTTVLHSVAASVSMSMCNRPYVVTTTSSGPRSSICRARAAAGPV